MTTRDINPSESPVKRVLDRLEIDEGVAALSADAAEVNLDERGRAVLVLPKHPAIDAYLAELATIVRPTSDNLKTARRRLRAARLAYDTRVTARLIAKSSDIHADRRFASFASLSAILEARADAMHWHRLVVELADAARTNKHNARTIEQTKLHRAGLQIGAAIKKAIQHER